MAARAFLAGKLLGIASGGGNGGGALPAADAETLEDARGFGASAEQLAVMEADLRAAKVATDFEGVWPVNAPAVTAFAMVAGQWRIAPSGRVLGLDYAACDAGWRRAGLEVDATAFAGVAVMEREAASILNEGAR
jgi:hypothetical protein